MAYRAIRPNRGRRWRNNQRIPGCYPRLPMGVPTVDDAVGGFPIAITEAVMQRGGYVHRDPRHGTRDFDEEADEPGARR